ncbi:MAG: extracellular solute-binding protein [Mobilicoccus sp.]|nr:extracellular solute-binding protein [Mobilicoccus sp.]
MATRSPRPLRSLAVLAAGTALVLSGCGNGGQEASADPATGEATTAESDGTVVLYSGRNEALVQPILDAFTQETGIEVEVRYGKTAEMAAQLLEEGDRTPADVFLAQDAGALGAVAKEGLVSELPQETLDRVPGAYRDDEGGWVGVTGRARVLVYDPAQVTEEQLPDHVDELIDPAWKGKVGIAPTNASFQAFVTAMRVAEGEEKTLQFLEGLRANDAQIREKNGQIVADVDSGTLASGLVNHYYMGELAAEKGVEVNELNAKLHFFGGGDLGGLVNVSGVALTPDQPDTDGQQLIDYLLSDEAQTTFVEETYEYPLVAGIQGPEGVPSLSELQQPDVDLNDLDSLAETVELVKRAGLS